MELKYLNTVRTILETGSFGNAARKLNYTQSTITFQIQQLEQELHIKLFEKIGRKMVLTQAGEDMLPYVDIVLQSVEQITNLGKSLCELTGTIRIAMPESLLVYKIQPALKAFRSQASKVTVSLQILNCYEISQALMKGTIDVGVHYQTDRQNPSILCEEVASFPLALAASPLLSQEEQDFTSNHQVKEITHIYGDPNNIYYELFCDYLKKKDIVLGGNIMIQSIEAIKRSVSSNLGVAYLPEFAVDEELKANKLQKLPIELSNQAITAVISYHKNKWISASMELFIRLIKNTLS